MACHQQCLQPSTGSSSDDVSISNAKSPVPNLLARLSINDLDFSRLIIQYTTQNIGKLEYFDFYPSLLVLDALMDMSDDLAEDRVNEALGSLLSVMSSNSRYYKSTELCLAIVCQWDKKYSLVHQWLSLAFVQKSKGPLAWIDKWVHENRKPPKLAHASGSSSQSRLYKAPLADNVKPIDINVPGRADLAKLWQKTTDGLKPKRQN